MTRRRVKVVRRSLLLNWRQAANPSKRAKCAAWKIFAGLLTSQSAAGLCRVLSKLGRPRELVGHSHSSRDYAIREKLQTDERMNERKYERRANRTKRTSEPSKCTTSERTKERTNERTSEQANFPSERPIDRSKGRRLAELGEERVARNGDRTSREARSMRQETNAELFMLIVVGTPACRSLLASVRPLGVIP